MNEQTQPAHEDVIAVESGMPGGSDRPGDQNPDCPGSFARVAALIMSRADDVDLCEMLLRLRRWEL